MVLMDSTFQSHVKVSKSVVAIELDVPTINAEELGGKPNFCHEIFYKAVGVGVERHLSLGRITTLYQSYTC